jgi:hypothetical protein
VMHLHKSLLSAKVLQQASPQNVRPLQNVITKR